MENVEHNWILMFTQKKEGITIYSFLRCADCNERKEVKGEFKKEMKNTWSSNSAKYTK